MRILGIETSCDETAVCLIEANGEFGPDFKYTVLGNALFSQVATHAPYGGVFPNLARREHQKNLVPLLAECLRDETPGNATSDTNNIDAILSREPELLELLKAFLQTHARPNIDAIAVTSGPGLEPALWVGVNFAKALAAAWDLPIVAVNHLEGHTTIAAMHESGAKDIEFPALALLVSGGHTELDLMPQWMDYKMIGETRDDAVGEAFDKVARMIGLPYPGGPEVARLAAEHRNTSESIFKFSRPMLNQDNYDFSFSGLKTEVRKVIGDHEITPELQKQIARSFEDAAADVLVKKTMRAVEELGAKAVLVGGGVSANVYIKVQLGKALETYGAKLITPPAEYATDNALMIALAGYFHALKKEFADPTVLRANGNLRLG